jgi:hypothetical protein
VLNFGKYLLIQILSPSLPFSISLFSLSLFDSQFASGTNIPSSYTCGAPWRTCGCSESDEQHRQRELAELRRARAILEARAEQEQAETAAAIAEVEAMEMRETERRIQEEEELNRQQQLAIEQDVQRLTAIGERMAIVQDLLTVINKSQQNALLDRQSRQEKQVRMQIQSCEANFREETRTLAEQLKRNQKSRLEALKVTHAAALQQLNIGHRKKKSELTSELDRLLIRYSESLDSNDHKNSIQKIEERERSILRHLCDAQEKEWEVVSKEHELALKDLKCTFSTELRDLQNRLQHWRERGKEENRNVVRVLVEAMFAERIWFDKAVTKRQELAERYSEELINGQQTLSAPSPQCLPGLD